MRDTHMQECERKMLPYVSFVSTSLKSQLHQAGQAKRAKVGFFVCFVLQGVPSSGEAKCCSSL